jgi:energy-dependent translational throttle protein EttA
VDSHEQRGPARAQPSAHRGLRAARAREGATADNDSAASRSRPGPPLGDQVIEFKNVSKGYGEYAVQDLSFSVPKGAMVGVIGPNGTGKTTLMKLITGQEQPDAGEVFVADDVKC